MKCKFLFAAVLSSLALGMTVIKTDSVHAASNERQELSSTASAMIYWSGTAYLVTNAYSNVTSSNNILNDSPAVTNNSGNKGSIKVKVVDETGARIGSIKTVDKGKTVRLDSIPWNSGTYTIKAMAVSAEGTYAISID